MTLSRQTPVDDMPEIAVPMDTVCYIIAKAREFDVKAGSSDPSASTLDDDNVDAAVLEDRPSDPVMAELRSIIDDLTEEAQIDLVTLMWIGREDGTAGDWADYRRTADEEHNERTARYLLGTPLLADHLENGLDAIGRSCGSEMETNL